MAQVTSDTIADALAADDAEQEVQRLDAELTARRAELAAMDAALEAAGAAKASAEGGDDEDAIVSATREGFRLRRTRAALDAQIAELETARLAVASRLVAREAAALDDERAEVERALAAAAARLADHEQRLLALRTRKHALGLPLTGLTRIPQRIARRMAMEAFEQFGIVAAFHAGKPIEDGGSDV